MSDPADPGIIMSNYLNLTNLIRLLVLASFAYWVFIDIPRWWRKRQAAKASLAPSAPRPPRAPRLVLRAPGKKAAPQAAPAAHAQAAEAATPVRRRTLGAIAAAHGAGEGATPHTGA